MLKDNNRVYELESYLRILKIWIDNSEIYSYNKGKHLIDRALNNQTVKKEV